MNFIQYQKRELLEECGCVRDISLQLISNRIMEQRG